MTELRDLKCVPCRGDAPPLTALEISTFNLQTPDWKVVEVDSVPRLERTFKFKDFSQALAFTNNVGELAEAEEHHPAILTEWGKVTVTWWTHKIHGLHQNDFIMAVKTDAIFNK